MNFLMFLFLLVGCSNLSNNLVKEGDFSIVGGVQKNKTWNNSLDFERYSWFHELTLFLDIMATDIDEKSPFYNWFSKSEKKLLSPCKNRKIILLYQFDSKKITKGMFLSEVKKTGFREIRVPEFTKALNMHPDHEKHSLQLYKTFALCSSGPERVAKISFPSFKEVLLR